MSHARNRGWQEAQGQYVAYLDDDAKASSDWCERILAAFREQDAATAAVGGKILPWYLKKPPEWFSDVLETRSWGDVPRFLSTEQARYGFSGSNMAFRRDVLSEYNGFNARFGMVGNKMYFAEETELFYRISADSNRLWYDPEILVYHLVTDANMKCAHRFLRGYRAGTAMIHLEQRRVFSKLYMFNLRKLVITLINFPMSSSDGIPWRSRYALWVGIVGCNAWLPIRAQQMIPWNWNVTYMKRQLHLIPGRVCSCLRGGHANWPRLSSGRQAPDW